jgi:predicted amidohydrolase
MKVGVLQFKPEFGQKEKNLAAVEKFLNTAQADLVVLPELFTTGYLFLTKEELTSLAEPIPGPTTERLSAIARKNNFSIVAGIAEFVPSSLARNERVRDERALRERAPNERALYNSAVLVKPDGSCQVYRKAHLFRDEKKLFAAGDTPFTVHDIGTARIGMLICFDYMFPEATRTLVLKGAQIICHPANLVLPVYGQEVPRTRAIENRVFFVTANRFGVEERGKKKVGFTGESQIVNPRGEVLVRAPASGDCLKVIEIDPKEADNKKVTELNDLFRDRRTDLYEL